MTFTSKLNIDDSIWMILNGRITEEKIVEIQITQNPCSRSPIEEIFYGTTTTGVHESDQGISWWASKKDLIVYLLSQMQTEEIP